MKRKSIFSFVLALCLMVPCMFMLNACAHTHTASTEWSSDETEHWHTCTYEDCDERLDVANHTWNDGEITLEATSTNEGVKTYTCTVCGKTKTETIAALGATTGTASFNASYNPGKVYDSEVATAPVATDYTSNGDGAVTVEWYSGDTKLTEAPTNAGTYKVKLSVAATDNFTAATAEKEFTIAKKCLTLKKETIEGNEFPVLRAVTKTYDGTKTVTLANPTRVDTLTGIVDGDDITYTSVCGDFNTKDAGGERYFDVTYTFSGEDSANYTLPIDGSGSTLSIRLYATIAKKQLTVTGTQARNKVYDGTTNIVLQSAGTLAGVISGETVNFDVAQTAFTNKNVGTYNISIIYRLNGADKDNYIVPVSTTVEAQITKKPLTGVSVTKEYDGDCSMTTTLTETANGVVASESVKIEFLLNGCVAGATTVDTSSTAPITLSSNNYSCDYSELSGSITQKHLTNIVATKEYNGYSAGITTLTPANGLVGEESLSMNFTMSSKNVGATLSSFGFYKPDSAATAIAANYTTTTNDITASITKRTISNVNPSRIYNGSTNISFTCGSVNNMVNDGGTNDIITVSFNMTDKNVGTNKQIDASSISLAAGNTTTSVDNYKLNTAQINVTITKYFITTISNAAYQANGEYAPIFSINQGSTNEQLTINLKAKVNTAGTYKIVAPTYDTSNNLTIKDDEIAFISMVAVEGNSADIANYGLVLDGTVTFTLTGSAA